MSQRPLAAALIAFALLTPTSPGQFTEDDVPRDNLQDNYVHWDTQGTQLVYQVGASLLVCNPRSHRLEVWTTTSPPTLNFTVETGQSPVWVGLRPGTAEAWVVCYGSNSISVVDLVKRKMSRSIPTAAGPSSMVFDTASGSAWVVSIFGRLVERIDLATTAVVSSVAIPARRPCDLALAGTKLFVISRLSGNGTMVFRNQITLDHFILEPTGALAIPDRDVFCIDVGPSSPTFGQITGTISDVGTVLFGVAATPAGNELWVTNTDAHNEVQGEENFVAGDIVDNRISVIDLATNAISFIDLDQPGAGLPGAQPLDLVMSAATDRAYVCALGSSRVVVVQISTKTVLGSYDLQAANGFRSMPETAWLHGSFLTVFDRGTNGFARFDVTQPLGSGPVSETPLWHAVPDAILKGQGRFNNADLSADGAGSCASCHPFGDADGIAWDIGGFLDPEGTPNGGLQFPKDDKGPMLTQPLKGLPETGPYHWRGERKDIEAFNAAFVAPLDATMVSPEEMGEIVEYLNSLVYEPNSNQQPDRSMTPDELGGAQVFLEELVDSSPVQSFTCDDCHTLPTGANGEPMLEVAGEAPAIDVPQLRQIFDRENGVHPIPGFADATDTGVGFAHNGIFPTLEAFVSVGFMNLDATEIAQLSAFMQAMDTGLAPATARQRTMRIDNPNSLIDLLQLMAQADAGHCGLTVTGYVGGFRLNMMYRRNQGTFLIEDSSLPANLPWSVLNVLAGVPDVALTLTGVPLGQEGRIVDRDYDGLLNQDEVKIHGTDPENADTDGDGFPDGHEVQNGMNPLVVDATSTDVTAPTILSITPIYTTANTVKLSVETDELCKVQATWTGTRPNVSPEVTEGSRYSHGDLTQQLIIGFLPHGSGVGVIITATDQAGNSTSTAVVFNTDDIASFRRTFTEDTTLTAGPPVNAGGVISWPMTGQVLVHDDTGPVGTGETVHVSVYYQDDDGTMSVVATDLTGTTDATGTATLNFNVIDANLSMGLNPREVTMIVQLIDSAAVLDGYVDALDKTFCVTTPIAP